MRLGAGDITEDIARVWIEGRVVVGRMERARRLVVSPERELVVRIQRTRLAWLAIMMSNTLCQEFERAVGIGERSLA